MAKTSSKTTTQTTTPAQTSTPATVETTPVVAPVKAPKTPKAPKAPKTEATPSDSTIVATPVEAAPKKVKAAKVPKTVDVVAAPVVVADETTVVAAAEAQPVVSNDFSSFSTKLQQVSALLSALKSEFRTLERKASRELKTATKAGAKRKRKTGNRSPSGFVKPTLISSELATFLGKTQGTEMARTEVTREINAYIRANSLQDKTNGRKINADPKLSSLLKLKTDEELTYFNLQRYMSPHFQKAAAAAALAAAVPVA
jgi:chromatin remodeling complex protein RSC6